MNRPKQLLVSLVFGALTLSLTPTLRAMTLQVAGASSLPPDPGFQSAGALVASVASTSGALASITVNQTGATTVAALTGDITLTLKNGNTIKVNIGTGAIIDTSYMVKSATLADAMQFDTSGALKADLNAAVQAIAASVAATTDPTASAQAVTLLATIVKVASAANSGDAASYVATATAAIAKSPALAGQTSTAINTMVVAATSSSSVDKSAVAAAANQAAAANGLTNYTAPTNATVNPVATSPITPIDPTIAVSPSSD